MNARSRVGSFEGLEARLLLTINEAEVGDFGGAFDETAYVVPFNRQIRGQLNDVDDTDVIAFDAVRGQVVTFNYQGSRVDVRLVDSDVEYFTGERNSRGLDRDDWKAPADGRYFLELAGTFSSYVVTIQSYATNLGALSAQALSDLQTVGEQVVSAHPPRGASAWYSFEPKPGKAYTFTPLTPDIRGWLYAADGFTQLAGGGSRLGQEFVYAPDSTDRLFLIVSQPPNELDQSEEFIFGVRESDVATVVVEPEPDDQSLTFGAPHEVVPRTRHAEASETDQLERFSFRAVAGEHHYVVNATMQSLAAATVNILSPTGELVESRIVGEETNDHKFVFAAREDGVFTIEVTSLNSTGTYSVGVSVIADDHGDQVANATPLIPNTTRSGRLESGTDIDLFSFEALKGELYHFEIAVAGMDHLILLQAPDDAPVEISPDDLELWQAPHDGTYFLSFKALGERSNDEGQYRLTFEPKIDDHANQRGPQETLIPTNGEVVAATLELVGDVDFFAFEAVPDQRYRFSGNLTPRVFDSSGRVVPVTVTLRNRDFQVMEQGVYFLEFARPYAPPLFDYTFSIDVVDDDRSGTPDVGNPIPESGPFSGRTDFYEDRDVFAFNAIAGEDLRFSSDRSHSLSIDILGSTGELLATGNSPSLRIPTSGTYFMVAQGRSDGEYTIQMETIVDDFPDEDFSQAPVLQSHQPTEFHLASAGDVDRVLIDVFEGQEVEFELRLPLGCCIEDVTLEVIDLATGTVAASFREARSWNTLFHWAPNQDGRFGVSLRSPVEQTVQLEARIADDFPDKPSDVTQTVAAGFQTIGRVDRSTDIDLFKIELQVNDALRVRTEIFNPRENVNESPRRVSILSATGDTIVGLGSDEAEFKTPSSGTYFVGVSGVNWNVGGEYALSVEVAPDDYPDTPNFDAARSPLGQTLNAELETVGDVDVFPFEVVAQTAYRLIMKESNGLSLRANIYSDDGTTLIASPDHLSYTWKPSESGTIFVSLDSLEQASQSYSLSLATTDFRDDFPGLYSDSGVTRIPNDNSVSGSIEVLGDLDVWSFQAEANEGFNFAFRRSTIGWNQSRIRLLTDQGEVLAESTNSILSWQSTEAGRYFLEFTITNAIRDYVLEVESSIDEHPDSINQNPATIEPGGLLSPFVLQGRLDSRSDIDVFQFDALAGEIISVAPNDGKRLPRFYILDANETVFSSRSPLPADGTYFLAIENGPRNYDLAVRTEFDDHGNEAGEATALQPQDSTNSSFLGTGSLQYPRDVDVFTVDVSAGQGYRASYIGNSQGLKVVNADGERVTRSPDYSWKLEEDQTVTISVGGGNDLADYQLLVEAVDDDYPDHISSDATVLELDTPLRGSSEVRGDQDVFRFQVDGGTNYAISTESESSGGWRISDASGEVILGCSCPAVRWRAPETATYYLTISSDPSDYAITYTEIEDTDQHVDVVSNEATQLEIGESTTGKLETFNDIDVFAVELEADRSYKLTSSSSHNLDVSTESGPLFNLSGFGTTEFHSPRGEKVFLSVSVRDVWRTDYDFSLSLISDEYPDRITSTDVVRLVDGVWVEGSLDWADDVDVFSFEARSGEAIRLDALRGYREFSLEYALAVVDESGQLIAQENAGQLDVSVPSDGQYFVKLSRFSPENPGQSSDLRFPYSLRLSRLIDDAVGEVNELAGKLAFDVPVSAELEVKHDVDVFSVDIAAGQEVVIEARRQSIASNSTLSILNRDGDILASRFGGTLQWIADAAGQYFISVTGSAPTKYVLTVSSTNVDAAIAKLNADPPGWFRSDLNGDGDLGFADFLLLSSEFGRTTREWQSAADINESGIVDFADFLLFAEDFARREAR